MQALSGKEGFLTPERLKTYNDMRNDPCSPKAVSTLSAYLHFGHISGQRVALEASKHRKKYKVSTLSGSYHTSHAVLITLGSATPYCQCNLRGWINNPCLAKVKRRALYGHK